MYVRKHVNVYMYLCVYVCRYVLMYVFIIVCVFFLQYLLALSSPHARVRARQIPSIGHNKTLSHV